MTGGPAAGAVGSGRADAAGAAFDVVDPTEFASLVPALAVVLADAVDSGSSVNFLSPFSVADATRWWEAQAPAVAAADLRPVVARLDGVVAGCACLVPSRKANSPHRAEVVKVLVHRRARRRGIGAGLMAAIEDLARVDGRWLLILDTTTGSDADRLYRRLGWTPFGEVPNHALRADGTLSDTTYFFKDLRR
jgi:GNAT superfamily N-acetyltransferase